MTSLCANSTIYSFNSYISLHSKNISVFNFMPPIKRNFHSPSAIRCSNVQRGKFSDPSYVTIFDTTLRDGEQAPGASMTTKQKMDIACQLAKLGVDVIEVGFPAASQAEFELVKLAAQKIGNLNLCLHLI
ncbi:hypothetical protein R3W88_022442 [Solanum pinnatisectum]|uniref:Pyruvate carboxyltransferase domain-containing protein n=1 Tax=Solanum pinnatisectum TaxID=50273 RepID=A0AAV9LY04_9SOLN|nr:hypothetical protein R3W88_022442 [Solanum pinnatisectum]